MDDKPKGILKKNNPKAKKDARRAATFDEMNIISTLHPEDKDYGHDKIPEAKTPFNYQFSDEASTSTSSPSSTFNPLELAAKIKAFSNSKPTVVEQREKEDVNIENESSEERQKRLEFQQKRKQHYDEYHTVKKLEKNDKQGPSSKK